MINIEILKKGIPVTEDPYRDLAVKLGMDKKQLIEELKNLIQNGTIVKFRALLDHKKLGYVVNALIAMRTDDLNNILPESGLVSHFYIREMTEKFPYNIYMMVHFKSKNDLEDFSKYLGKMNIPHVILETIKDLKREKV